MNEDNICDECYECKYYWQNQYDDYMNCEGENEPCHEYVPIKTCSRND